MSSSMLVGIALVLLIVQAHQVSSRFCMSCRYTRRRCNPGSSRCPNVTLSCQMQRCASTTDLCLATWRYTSHGRMTVLAGCFPLPSFSNRRKFKKNCNPRNVNGTFTCLCRRNGCNKHVFATTEAPTQHTTRQTVQTVVAPTTAIARQLLEERQSPSTSGTTSLLALVISIGTSIVGLSLLMVVIRGFYHSRKRGRSSKVRQVKASTIHELCHGALVSPCVLDSLIFRGKYSEVWKGTLEKQTVAVKIFPCLENHLWQNEFDIYTKCTPEHHNLLKILFAEENKTSQSGLTGSWIATEYCANGSLRQYLKQTGRLRWEQVLRMCRGVTAGLAYLHSDRFTDGSPKSPIAHQDMKSTNVLVQSDGNCVLSDLALALDLSHGLDTQGFELSQVGTYRYMAPEKLETRIDVGNRESYKQIDVYALALVLWEISSCHLNDCKSIPSLPYEDVVGSDPTLQDMTQVVVMDQARPLLPFQAADHLGENFRCLLTTFKECWDSDPDARLTAECAHARIRQLR